MDAAQYLQIYDTNIIYSWTPREWKNFLKGAKLRNVDEQELLATGALFNVKAKGLKGSVSVKKIFDAEKSRKAIVNEESKKEKTVVHLDRWKKAQEAMKSYGAMSIEKGG